MMMMMMMMIMMMMMMTMMMNDDDNHKHISLYNEHQEIVYVYLYVLQVIVSHAA